MQSNLILIYEYAHVCDVRVRIRWIIYELYHIQNDTTKIEHKKEWEYSKSKKKKITASKSDEYELGDN